MPAQFACTPAQNEQVKALLSNGVPAKKIGALVRPPIGYSTVLKMRKNFQNFGTTETHYDTKFWWGWFESLRCMV